MSLTSIYQGFIRHSRKVVLGVLTFAVAATGTFFSTGGVAHADVPRGIITNSYLNLTNPSLSAMNDYRGVIGSLRSGVGHSYRNGSLQTQSVPRDANNQPNHYVNGLTSVTLRNGNTNLILWFTPGDLYLRGFTNTYGTTFQFNDGDYNLFHHFDLLSGRPAGGGQTLSFGSNYNSMNQAAHRGRESMPISFNDLWNSVFNLAYVTNPYGANQQDVARSLMFMIQFTSESARFNDVYGVMADIMGRYGAFYNGLPMLQQRLENAWNPISDFGYNITANPSSPPRSIEGVGTLRSWNDVARYVAILLNNNNMGLPEVGPKGDWGHTEL